MAARFFLLANFIHLSNDKRNIKSNNVSLKFTWRQVNGYLFCKQTKRKHYNTMKPLHCKKSIFFQKCGLICHKFQVSHAQRNHCLWDDICFDRVFFVSLGSFDYWNCFCSALVVAAVEFYLLIMFLLFLYHRSCWFWIIGARERLPCPPNGWKKVNKFDTWRKRSGWNWQWNDLNTESISEWENIIITNIRFLNARRCLLVNHLCKLGNLSYSCHVWC